MIDASGSVLSKFNDDITIFGKMEEIIKTIKSDQFRLIFWNSDIEKNGFTDGIFKIPYVTKKEAIKQPFTIVKNKITSSCLTFPHLGIKNISEEWISNSDSTHIYIITDGQIGYSSCTSNKLNSLKSDIKNEIEKLFKKFNNIHFHIITIEAKVIDLNQSETLNSIAGGDIFKIILENNLTQYITEFTSYTQNNEKGYKHINNLIVPKGFIPFGDRYFSEMKTNQFIKYLQELVKETKDEDDLLKILQNLSNSLSYLIKKDKPKNIIKNIINTFCENREVQV